MSVSVLATGYKLIGQRFSSIANAEGVSNISRLYIPGYLAYVSITEKPIFGFGLSNLSGKQEEINRFVRRTFGPLKFDNIENLLKNAFLEHIINFGLIGGVLIMLPFYLLSRNIKVQGFGLALSVVSCIAVGITGYNDPRLWTILIVVLFVQSKSANSNLQQILKYKWKLEQ